LFQTISAWRQRVAQMLFGISDRVPARYRRYVIASNFMFVFALAGHTLFVPVYWILDGPQSPSFIVNLLFVPIDALCLYLNYHRRYRAAFGIWVGVVVVHTGMSTVIYGWDAGFHYYFLSLAVFVGIAPWRKIFNSLLIAGLAGIYIWLNRHDAGTPPPVALSAGMNGAIWTINIVMNFIILGYLANYYALAAAKIQEALEESEKMLKTTLSVSPVGIALIQHRKIAWANETMKAILGYDTIQPLDFDVLRFFPNIREVDTIRHQAYDMGQAEVTFADSQLVRRDGSVLPCLIKIRPMVPRDESKGSLVAVMDITAQKMAEQENAALLAKVQRSEKMEVVGRLAGGVAHDLNNILTGILSYPELLLMNMAADNPMRKPLVTIQRCGEKAATIVQDLLTLARRGVHNKQVVDWNAVVTEYLGSPEHDKLRTLYPKVRFTVDLCAGPATVVGSPVHLSKTLMNLVSNACEAMSQVGRVRVGTEIRRLDDSHCGFESVPPGTYVVVSVVDDGDGISAENLERIFEPFYTKKVMGRSGTGLGLAVVWGTVKDSDGFVDVVSRPGRETRFELFFPAAGVAPAMAVPLPCLDDYHGAGEHVLVVDDMAEQRLVAANMLAKLGYRVDVAESGEAAVSWLQVNQSDLLLLDMIMDPGIDGYETYRRILEYRPGQKALIASGYSETRQVSKTMDLGASGYMRKPYTLLTLAKAIRTALSEAA